MDPMTGRPTEGDHATVPWRRGRAGAWVALGLLVVSGAAAVAVYLWFRAEGTQTPAEERAVPPEDPRRTYRGPFENVHPDVAYVGDAACASCHRNITATYRQTAMGRSLAPIAAVADAQRYDASVRNPFTAFKSRFEVVREGKRVLHRQTRLDAQGKPIYEQTQEVHYVLGSGTRGCSYLTERDGFVFQTPISWFTQAGIWDVSPGFTEAILPGRRVIVDCLYCHVNRVLPVEGTANRYESPLFQGHAIGCERCHGPGGNHVKNPGNLDADGIDRTIVNPRHLEPGPRESVCQQCHLAGEVRIARRGRSAEEFRPGLPLEAFFGVYVPDEPFENARAVSHVEQLAQSRCFQKSDGRLGCISCHDPHATVPAVKRVAHYRAGCLQCHEKRGCHLPEPARRARSAQDNCVTCHMPKTATTDIAHTAGTDHRILRHGKSPAPPPREDKTALRDFHRGRPDLRDPAQVRDMGVALAHQALANGTSANAAIPLLRQAIQAFPDDRESRAQLGTCLLLENRPQPALEQFRVLLERTPNDELALASCARALTLAGRDDEALLYWRRASEVDPWDPDNRGALARGLAARKDWDGCRPQAEAWVRLAPGDLDARKLLIRCLVQIGRHDEARAELDRVCALQPLNQAGLRSWFDDLRR